MCFAASFAASFTASFTASFAASFTASFAAGFTANLGFGYFGLENVFQVTLDEVFNQFAHGGGSPFVFFEKSRSIC